MYAVKSRYKNPDVLIKRLRSQINQIRSTHETLIKNVDNNAGVYLGGYAVNNEHKFGIKNHIFLDACVNDKLIVVGKVKSICRDGADSYVVVDNIHFRSVPKKSNI